MAQSQTSKQTYHYLTTVNKKHKAIEKKLYLSLYHADHAKKMWDATPKERNMRRHAIWRAQCLNYGDLGFDVLEMSAKILATMPDNQDFQLGHALDYRQF